MKTIVSLNVRSKGIFIFFLFFIFGLHHVNGQCLNSAPYGTGAAPATIGETVTITTCAFAGEYSTITGVTYNANYSSNSTGGSGNYITIRQGTYDGPVVAHGPAPVLWTAPASGNYFQHVNTNSSCGTESLCRVQTVTRIACITPGIPLSLSGIAFSYNSAHLSWSHGTPLGNQQVTYLWEVRRSSDQEILASGTTLNTFESLTGLECGTTYNFRVKAQTNCDGTTSAWSSNSNDFTTFSVIAPTNVTATPSTICMGETSTLNAVSPGNLIYWYEQASGGTEIATSESGQNLTLLPSATTTYWAETQTSGHSLHQLYTNLTSNNQYSGNFFDVVNISDGDISISAFDINTSEIGPYTVHVYYRTGTCEGNTNSSAGWAYLGAHNTTGEGINNTTYVQLNSNITIPAGQTFAFYLSGINFNYINGNAVGNTCFSDENLHIKEGYGTELVNGFGGALFSPRIFSGSIYYNALTHTTYNLGPIDPSFGISSDQNFTYHWNIFDVFHTPGITISNVDIFFTAAIGSNFTITLSDNVGTLLATYSGQITVTGGPAQTVPINFFVPAGSSYRLAFSLNPGSVRNSTAASYPYTVPGIISITGNTFDPLYYYWFYNWLIKFPAETCISASRTPVTLTVLDCTSVNSFESSEMITVFPNPVKEQLSVKIVTQNTADYVWVLIDMNGRTVQTGSEKLSPGENLIDIQTEQLNTGVYMLKSELSGMVHYSRIIKH